MTPNIADLVAKLKARDAALGELRDVPDTLRARQAFWTQKADIARAISGLMNAPDDLARVERQLAECEERRTMVVQKQTSLEQEIAAAPDWRLGGDGRQRDAEYDRQRNLKLQHQLLHEGRLLRAPGVAYESLAFLDTRIGELTERRDRARLALDSFMKQAEALLAEQPVAS